MNKPSKIALALAFAAAAVTGAASAQQVRPVADEAVIAQNIGSGENNWKSPFGLAWLNGSREHCWRTPFWTPETGIPGCDGTVIAQVAAPAAAPAPTPAPAPVSEKVTYAADTFFDFDKSTIKPDGRQMLDELVRQVQGLNLEVIIAVGHTDWIGTDAYNLALSQRRAAAVKEYLVSKGIDPNRVYTEGKGKANPIADNRTREGRAKNRRVELEVVGTRN